MLIAKLSASRFVVMASARPQRREENPIENFFLFFNWLRMEIYFYFLMGGEKKKSKFEFFQAKCDVTIFFAKNIFPPLQLT